MSDLVKCNSGHESPQSMWDCPVCTDVIRDQLTATQKKLDKAVEALKLAMDQNISHTRRVYEIGIVFAEIKGASE